ncbi:OmpA family protein [Novosphingobium sp.]|uniref:OmpA family protein n=1 Tax=Novosphingobium sp. TaxID=1874826 RepID=UPI0027325C66|nr:OmpA family protein [Novosphingobium sp.]MDP3908437.1 OmpA family protein [Novosphingobium sp.]
MRIPPLILAGAAACGALAFASLTAHGQPLIAALEARTAQAAAAAGGAGVAAQFRTANGWLTRHPVLTGGRTLAPTQRSRVAAAVAAVPGVGGVQWAPDPARRQDSAAPSGGAMHCQRDVDGILKTRTIRFAEASAALDPVSEGLLDEVAAALRPCAGSIIAITGHTDAQGLEDANVALSLDRARTVREALVRRGIARSDLRARGLGSATPVDGLEADDPANRRIEFSVVSPVSLRPTLIDTPGAG